jgi:hypothetical protein
MLTALSRGMLTALSRGMLTALSRGMQNVKCKMENVKWKM